MSKRLLPLVPADLVVDQVLPTPDCLTILCRSRVTAPLCPDCGHPSSRRHSSYPRRLADLPWQGRRVQIELQVRRLRCGRPGCVHRIFAERMPAVAGTYAQRTARLGSLQHHIGLALGGKAGARLACLAGALSYAFAGIFGRRFKRMGVSAMATAAGQVSASTVLLLPIMLLVDQPWTLPAPHAATWAAVLGVGLLSTTLAYVLYFRILAAAGATNLLLVTFLIPVSAILLGALVLGEALLPRHFSGMALIGMGLACIDGRLPRLLLRRRAAGTAA